MTGALAFLRARLWFIGWLVAAWVALWGDVSVANVAGGVAVAVTVLLAFPSLAPGRLGTVRPLAVVRLAAYFLAKLVQANVNVAAQVLAPRNERVNEAIVAVGLHTRSPAVMTLIANAITLTPGTITVSVREDPPTLYVHVLQLRTVEDTRRAVAALERRALEAFGDAATITRGRDDHPPPRQEDRP